MYSPSFSVLLLFSLVQEWSFLFFSSTDASLAVCQARFISGYTMCVVIRLVTSSTPVYVSLASAEHLLAFLTPYQQTINLIFKLSLFFFFFLSFNLLRLTASCSSPKFCTSKNLLYCLFLKEKKKIFYIICPHIITYLL